MKYYEVEFTISPMNPDASDILAALAGEAGFETFEETGTGLTGYIQQALYDENTLKESLEEFPFENITINYKVREAEDRDWNEQWEQEGFEPIIVQGESDIVGHHTSTIVIHDGRHLPSALLLSDGIAIEVDARMAFGTGTHETTQMICSILLTLDLTNKQVLDCGTGTGILSICALKLGASKAVGYDIDEWSADNARHNAVINRVDENFTSMLGDATILNNVEGEFDLVMANINRNILLADLPVITQKMVPDALIILSGFYVNDIPVLTKKGETLGLTLIAQRESNSWASLLMRKSA